MNNADLSTSNDSELLVESSHISNAIVLDSTENQNDSNQDPRLNYATTVMNKTYDFETRLSRNKTISINKEVDSTQTCGIENDILNDSFKQSLIPTGDHITQINDPIIQHDDLNKVELPMLNIETEYRKKSLNIPIVSEKVFLVSNYDSDDD